MGGKREVSSLSHDPDRYYIWMRKVTWRKVAKAALISATALAGAAAGSTDRGIQARVRVNLLA